MKALLVGGPLNRQVIEVEADGPAVIAGEDARGLPYRYHRRGVYLIDGQERVLFVCGDIEHQQVIDAIKTSDMATTGKMRTLRPEDNPFGDEDK